MRRTLSHPSLAFIQAAEILGTTDLAEAEYLARRELWLARLCPVCRLARLRHTPSVGSQFRVRDLLEQLEPWERDEHSLRLVAAWIVLHGW